MVCANCEDPDPECHDCEKHPGMSTPFPRYIHDMKLCPHIADETERRLLKVELDIHEIRDHLQRIFLHLGLS